MNDVLAIAESLRGLRSANRPGALATVVSVEGSAYRRCGARMLITEDGDRVGSISGGCLEADVIARAQEVMLGAAPVCVHYDPRRGNGDVIVEFGCKGAVGILIESLAVEDARTALNFVLSFVDRRGRGAMATVSRTSGESAIAVGARLMLREGELPCGALVGATAEAEIAARLEAVMVKDLPETLCIVQPEGPLEVMIEPIRSPISLVLCGAGHDAAPVAEMARMIGWQVAVVGSRDLASDELETTGTARIGRPEHALPDKPLDPDPHTAVVIMTHSYEQDLGWLRLFLPSGAGYVGLLGPRHRAERLRNELAHDPTITRDQLEDLHCPIGLDLGAESPSEIALSVVSEIQAVLRRAPASSLSRGTGSIHRRAAQFAESFSGREDGSERCLEPAR